MPSDMCAHACTCGASRDTARCARSSCSEHCRCYPLDPEVSSQDGVGLSSGGRVFTSSLTLCLGRQERVVGQVSSGERTRQAELGTRGLLRKLPCPRARACVLISPKGRPTSPVLVHRRPRTGRLTHKPKTKLLERKPRS